MQTGSVYVSFFMGVKMFSGSAVVHRHAPPWMHPVHIFIVFSELEPAVHSAEACTSANT